MKKSALVVAAALGLQSASMAQATESGRLSADSLRQPTPFIHWPQGLEPRNVDVFVHNEGWIDAPPTTLRSDSGERTYIITYEPDHLWR